MRIYTEINYIWEKGRLIKTSSKSFEYNGEIALCVGGGGGGGLDGGILPDLGGDIVEDVVEDVVDVVEDVVDVVVDVVEDVFDEVFDFDDIEDPTEPEIIYTKDGSIGEVSGVAGVPIVYGTRRLRGILVYKELITQTENGEVSDEDFYVVFAISEGEIDGIDGVWVNGTFTAGTSSITGTASGASGFSNTWKLNKGTSDSGDDGFGFNYWWAITALSWSTSHNKLKAIANVQWHFEVQTGSVGRNINMPRVAFKVRGVKVRNNAGTVAFTSNPAWILRDYLTNTVYGVGLDDSVIDLASFNTAAGICDQTNSGTKRHECNLILDSTKPVISNVKLILKTCAGQLLWVSGKYKMQIDDTLAGSVALAFDSTNMIGGLSIVGESKQDKTNQITSIFIDPDNDWKPDTVSWPDKIKDASTYTQFLTTEDAGVELKHQIKLSGVTNYNQARFLTQQACLRSRNNLKVSFSATSEALNLIPSDVISVTHDTPGWTAKEFIVRSLTLNTNGTVKLACSEYQASTYTWNQKEAPAIVPDTNLPDPTSVTVPSSLAFTESVYESIASGGKKVRVTLSWTDNTDYYNSGYDFQFKKSADSSWTDGGTTVSTSGVLNDFEKGTFDFRVRARNSVGSVSDWVTITSQVISGVIPIPPDVVNFDVNILNGSANLTWDLPNDADVQAGGYLEIRNLQEGSTSWDDAVFLGQANPNSTNILLPLVEGNYVAKWITSDGNSQSVTFAEKGLGTVYWTNTIATFNEHPAWNGTMTGLYVADNDGDKVLKFESDGYINDFTALMDTWGTFDEQGGLETDGEYVGLTGHDLGAVFQTRVYTNKVFTSGVSDGSNYMDSWAGKIDSRTMWDETRNLSGITTYISTTEDDPNGASPTWTAWKSFLIADIKARGFKIKIKFESESSSEQFKMTELATLIDMPSRVMGASASATTTITYADPFYAPPNLVVTPTNLGNGEYYTISSETKTGFGINFFNSADSAITRNYNYLAKGY